MKRTDNRQRMPKTRDGRGRGGGGSTPHRKKRSSAVTDSMVQEGQRGNDRTVYRSAGPRPRQKGKEHVGEPKARHGQGAGWAEEVVSNKRRVKQRCDVRGDGWLKHMAEE